MEILPCLRFASLSLTIIYFICRCVVRLVIVTVDIGWTVSVLKRDTSTIFACEIVIFRSLILASR